MSRNFWILRSTVRGVQKQRPKSLRLGFLKERVLASRWKDPTVLDLESPKRKTKVCL